MKRPHKLFVLWRVPGQFRGVVGVLEHSAEGYVFSYADDLADTEARGFREIVGFPRAKGPIFRSPYLFATFAKRVPSPSRSDFSAMLQRWSVADADADDQLEILARSGGFQVGDRIELAEYRDVMSDDLTSPLEFRVAGPRHHHDAECAHAAPGDVVSFVREPENPGDRNAVQVRIVQHDLQLGFVPRQYAALFARLLSEGRIVTGQVRRTLLVPHEGDRWVVEARGT